MAVTTANLVQGAGNLWVGAFGVAEPADDTTDIVIDPATGWADFGATDGGVNLSVVQTYVDLKADQIIDVADKRITARTIKVTTSLAEATLDNIAYAFNQVASVAGTGVHTLDLDNAIDQGASPTAIALIIDGYAHGAAKRRRIIVRKVVQIGAVGVSYSKDNQTMIPVEFDALYVSTSISPMHIIDED
jgi:hypothetical protein